VECELPSMEMERGGKVMGERGMRANELWCRTASKERTRVLQMRMLQAWQRLLRARRYRRIWKKGRGGKKVRIDREGKALGGK
jgi:hypothetical protein